MSVVAFIVIIALIALAAWFVRTQCPWIGQPFQSIIFFVLVLAAILVTLQAFGVLDELRSMQVPHV